MSKPRLGSGERFEDLKEKVGRESGVENPAAIAASIGRKKFGKRKFQSLAAKGRKRKN